MRRLIINQIENYKSQILFMNFIYALLNTISLVLLAIIFEKILISENAGNDSYLQYLQALGAILAPYITFVAKGFLFPMWRKIDTLFHLFFKSTYSEEEMKIIYDKD
ncbi:hypothetical protein [Cyclobacterium jeungdonense]|uniref:Uncharacterized protein n=1 Tax=Cyclobacterium jeungdonense TaxID=708087 RepID=A0ABT8C5M4_9BACT|nr:hypothetical protein [Cyclobacterium jeungdonense]MDN3687397.1 hypothetical protein [Cyclobacterium jeungdonense]